MAQSEHAEFIQELTAAQPLIYAYVYSLLPNRAAAQDVLQETNITLWKKMKDFRPGSSFPAWACRVAYFKVLSARRRMGRDLLVLDDSVFDALAERHGDEAGRMQRRFLILRQCMEKLPPRSRSLVDRRYAPQGSVQQLAREENRTVGAISQMLYRIREELLQCIKRQEQAPE